MNVIIDIMGSARPVIAKDHVLALDEVVETFIYWDPFTHADPVVAERLKPSHSFWDREEVLLAAPRLPGSLEAVLRLHDRSLLACYITRRPPSVAHHTVRWLEENRYPQLPVIHVGHTDRALYFSLCKSSACIEHGVTHMVDDQPHEVETLTAAGIATILVDAPVGRDKRREFMIANPHVPVAASLAHAVDMLFNEFPLAATSAPIGHPISLKN